MFFPKLTLTDAGRALIVKGMAGTTINFTKMALGNGEEPSSIRSMTGLVNLIADMQITNIEVGEGCAELEGSFDNGNLSEGFYASELGVFAKDPDAGEVLYAYANSRENATFIPSYSTNSFERTTFKLVVVVGDAEHVTATIGEYSGYTTKEAFETHISNEDNPHGVTKTQVGLSNVPNVSTNNQTPTYIESESLKNLISGETMKEAFGKIKKAVSSLIDHLKAENPHKITIKMIGAAPSKHNHSATQINDGVLSLQRGGTGKTTRKEAASSFMKEILSSGFENYFGDANKLTTPGIYSCWVTNPKSKHYPCDANFTVIVHKESDNSIRQTAIVVGTTGAAHKIWDRSMIDNVWGSWDY